MSTHADTPPGAKAVFPHAETDLVKKTGVSRKRIREARVSFQRDVDWTTDGKAVRWTEEAAGRLAVMLTGQDLPPEKNGAGGPVRAQFVVIRSNIPNPHLIECYRDGAKVFIRVTSNKNFRPAMKITAQLDGDGWTLVGRAPRFPGKW